MVEGSLLELPLEGEEYGRAGLPIREYRDAWNVVQPGLRQIDSSFGCAHVRESVEVCLICHAPAVTHQDHVWKKRLGNGGESGYENAHGTDSKAEIGEEQAAQRHDRQVNDHV